MGKQYLAIYVHDHQKQAFCNCDDNPVWVERSDSEKGIERKMKFHSDGVWKLYQLYKNGEKINPTRLYESIDQTSPPNNEKGE